MFNDFTVVGNPGHRTVIAKASWHTMQRHRGQIPEQASLRLDLNYDRAPHKGPVIIVDPPLVYAEKKIREGQKRPRKVRIERIPLFTNTSKMTAPSFSIPAGPMTRERRTQGTCPAALEPTVAKTAAGSPEVADQFAAAQALRSAPEHASRDGAYICDYCYAGKDMYVAIPLNAVRQALRLLWVHAALDEGVFVPHLQRALAFLRQLPARLQASQSWDTHFFRIHDSGDFFSEAYYAAWIHIIRTFAHKPLDIVFWAPTRLWVFPAWRQRFARLGIPRNLALRPSALFFGVIPPRVRDVPGITAGSTASHGRASSDWTDAKGVTHPPVLPGAGVWDCPAYDEDETDDRNCASVKCRRCWTAKSTPIAYREH